MQASDLFVGYSLPKHSAPSLGVASALIFLVLYSTPAMNSESSPDILGLRMGMKIAEVRSVFSNNHIALSERNAGELAAPRMPVPLEGVREVQLMCSRDALERIVITFELPPKDPTASNLIESYAKEKERLKSLFGPPTHDVTDMKAPTPQERHQWLTRGRGYCQATWLIERRLKVTIWVYGEDDGIVFTEIYESMQPR